MLNYAGQCDKDDAIAKELEMAGVEIVRFPEIMRDKHPEMRTVIHGQLHLWGFDRAWYYWVAKGPGIPVEDAEKLHHEHGKVVRVSGHCGCPSPREQYKGFGVGLYHVDTQEGLNALAKTIKDVFDRNNA